MTGRFRKGASGILLAACAVFGGGHAADAESLRQTLADAYRNSQLLEQNRYLLRIEDEDVISAVGALYPVLSFVASSTRDFVDDTTTTTASIVAEMVIYQGGTRRFAIEAARETVDATRQQLVVLEQQVLLDAVTAYLDVWEAIQVVDVRQRNVRVLTQQLRAARDRFEVGEDTRTDVAQAEAQLAAARSALAAAEGTLVISRELFNLAVGRYPNGVSTPGGIPNLPRTQDEAERLARQAHPSILALQHEVTAAELVVDQARGALRPTISLEASTGQVFSAPLESAEGEDTTLSLTLSQPIFRGGQLASQERAALAQVQAVRFSLNQQVLINLQSVGNAYASLQIANAQIQASDQQIEAAQLAFDGVREEAALGARTTLDVLDAEQDLLDARIGRIQAQSDLYLAAYSILSSVGLLTVQHLDLPVPQYDAEAYSGAFSGGTPRIASPQGDRLDSLLSRIGRE